MKNIITLTGAVVIGMSSVFVSRTAVAQTAVETTTTTSSAGTITDFSPDQITIRTQTDAEPMHYRYSKRTTYVDENGAPVSMEIVKSGLPVTVFYDKEGGDMVARKVIVRRTVSRDGDAATTVEKKTTYTNGTISEFGPNAFEVKSESGEAPMHYTYSKTTTYVDENGNPVSMDVIRSGAPVTVYYDREGDGMVARKVIVRRPETGAVIEHKKTTTTTEHD